MSDESVVDENRTNYEDVQNSNLAKNRFSNEDRQLDKNHDLFCHFFLNFSYVRVSFQSCVNLHVENSNIDFRLHRVRVNFDRDRHVKFFRIFDEMYQFILDQSEYEFMSNRSSFAKFMHFFKISTVFVNVLFVDQNIDVIDVFEKSCVRIEFVIHFQ